MKRFLLLLACGLQLAAASAPTPAPREPFWRKVLRIAGVSATPSQQKAPSAGLENGGEVWIADLKSGALRKCSEGGYHSPVFIPRSADLLVVKDEAVWRMSTKDGSTMKLFPVAGLIKLVGFDSADADTVLALVQVDHVVQATLITLSSGKLTAVPHDANSPDDRKALTHLKGWERVYGNTSLFVVTTTRPGLGGTLAWTDVMLKRDGTEPVNVSRSDGMSCGHPSLSDDGGRVVFIRAPG